MCIRDRLTLSKGDMPTDGFTGLAFSQNGGEIAVGGLDGTITLWDSQTGDHLHTFTGHENMVLGLAFSSNGTRLASVSLDSTAKVWDLTTGTAVATFTCLLYTSRCV